jgi:peptidoglycan/xylan/chitin deacetylase (PgdA/CDA1 family)
MSIKNNLDKSILYMIDKLGYMINPFILNFANEKKKILIFYFHGLYKSKEEKELNYVDPQNNLLVSEFVEFIEYFLFNKYHFIKPEDLLNDLPADKRRIMITFDDGYFNNTLAINILNQYKIPATFFITAKNVLENKCFWWDVVYKNRIRQGKNLKSIRKEQAHLKRFKYHYIENYLEQNFGKNCQKPWADIGRPLNPEELKTISHNPFVTIGNHTYNHSILTCYNPDEIRDELRLCNKILFEITGVSPNIIAFPNGNFNEEVLKITEEAGFRFAFTIENKLNSPPILNDKITCLNRFMVMPIKVQKYAGLNRLGYTPDSLYENLKKRLRFI